LFKKKRTGEGVKFSVKLPEQNIKNWEDEYML